MPAMAATPVPSSNRLPGSGVVPVKLLYKAKDWRGREVSAKESLAGIGKALLFTRTNRYWDLAGVLLFLAAPVELLLDAPAWCGSVILMRMILGGSFGRSLLSRARRAIFFTRSRSWHWPKM